VDVIDDVVLVRVNAVLTVLVLLRVETPEDVDDDVVVEVLVDLDVATPVVRVDVLLLVEVKVDTRLVKDDVDVDVMDEVLVLVEVELVRVVAVLVVVDREVLVEVVDVAE